MFPPRLAAPLAVGLLALGGLGWWAGSAPVAGPDLRSTGAVLVPRPTTTGPAPATSPAPPAPQAPASGATTVTPNAPPAATPTATPTPGLVVDPVWLADTARRAGLPQPALRAYALATLAAPGSCRIAWNTLAGIGWVESQHGTMDGRTLLEDGHSDRPVVGPALDGGRFAAIRATPRSTRWHGDPTWDHAVGPLQFIGSTWKTWGRDGDLDGVADPFDLDDAAATAVAYLCADGHDLTTPSGWSGAVFGYNHSDDYVKNVYGAAAEYAARVR